MSVRTYQHTSSVADVYRTVADRHWSKRFKETDMTVIQLNDRIRTLKFNLEKVQGTIMAYGYSSHVTARIRILTLVKDRTFCVQVFKVTYFYDFDWLIEPAPLPIPLTGCAPMGIEPLTSDVADGYVVRSFFSNEATQRLLDSCKSNPKLGNVQDTEDAMAKLHRQTYSLNDLIKRLEARYESMGGDQALAEAQSSLECTNPYGISGPISGLPGSLQKTGSRSDPKTSSAQDFDSDVDDSASPAHEGFGNYVGQATLKYDCEGNDQGCISGKAGEAFYVLEVDNDGSGWTAVVSSDGSRQGFLPTTHLSITLY
ncbi:hypothetical protein ACTXT7_005452 [Hymenolepis weldensis]